MIKPLKPFLAFFIIAIFYGGYGQGAVAQLEVKPELFTLVNLPEYTSHQAPHRIYKDKMGRLWLVYTTYVIQLSGDNVTTFAIPKFNNQPITHVDYSFATEFAGQVVISLHDKLLVFDESSQQLKPFHEQDFQLANPNDVIMGIDADKYGRLWVVSVEQAFILKDKQANFSSFEAPKKLMLRDYAGYTAINADEFGDIWLSSDAVGLLRVNSDDLTVRAQYKKNDLITTADEQEIVFFIGLSQLSEDVALVATELGLFQLDLQSGLFKRLFADTITSFVSDIQVAVDGSVLLFDNERAVYIEPGLTKAHKIDAKRHLSQFSTDYLALSALVDEELVYWLSVKGVGLFRYTPRTVLLEQLAIPDVNIDNLSQLLRLSDGRYVFVGIDGGYVEGDEASEPLIINDSIYTVTEGVDNVLWFGGEKQLLTSQANGKIQIQSGRDDDLNTGQFLSSYHDKKGRVWLIEDIKGLMVYDSQQHKAIDLLDLRISAEHRQQSLYVTGTQSGVWLVSAYKLTHFADTSIDNSTANSAELSSNLALDPTLDPSVNISKDVLIFGEAKVVVDAYRTDKWLVLHHVDQQVTMVDLSSSQSMMFELPVDNVGCLIEDGEYFWLAQRNGALYKWQRRFNQLTEYNRFDGLPYGGLNGKVCDRINDRLVFSSFHGLVSPKANPPLNQQKPKVTISHGLFGRLPHTKTGLSTGKLMENRAIDDSGHIVLLDRFLQIGADQFPVSFQIVNSSLTSVEQNITKYHLAGLNEQWQERQGSFNWLSYESLAPGQYTLQVKVSNNEGLFSEPSAINFEVLPLIWLRWWAKLFYLVFTLTVLYWLHTTRNRKIRERAVQLETMVAERTTELDQQKQKIEQLLDIKEQELINVSHELRTPLTLVAGPIKQALHESKEGNVQKLLSMANRNSARLLRMVEQLLQLERFQLQRVMDKSPQPISSLVSLIVESFYLPVKNKNQSLTLLRNDPCEMQFVPDAFEKTLINLIANAIKYSPEGGHIEVSSVKIDDTLSIKVKDSGIGIKAADQSRIFDRFFRVNDALSEKVTGAGIGLALVKQLVEAHGGQIRVTSNWGLGSEFTVELPIVAAVVDGSQRAKLAGELINLEIDNLQQLSENLEYTTPTANDYNENRTTILIIEDNQDMQQYIAGILQSEYHCVLADNGRIGVDKAIELVPDLIISDVMMPVMDGYEATKLIKESDPTSHIPVIMLTSRSDSESRKTGWLSLADEYLAKPFDDEELQMRVSNLLSIRSILRHKFASLISENGLIEPQSIHSLTDKERDFVSKMNEIMEKHYDQDTFGIDELSAALFMSRRQLLRKLKGLMDYTPLEYMRNYRLQKAAELLKKGHRVTEVTFATGFTSTSHFSTCFKAQFNVSPKAYQAERDSASVDLTKK